MKINWDEFDKNIKDNKYPLVLIKKFFSSLHTVDDYNASIMLRYIIKNNLDLFYDNPFYVLAENISKNKNPEVIKILEIFYEIVHTKVILLSNIKQWFDIYKNKKFWEKDQQEQIKELETKKNLIKANFDTSKGGISFRMKIIPILRNDNQQAKSDTIESICIRLRNILNYMGVDFFKKVDIPIFTLLEFYDLSSEDMIKYTNFVYVKIIDILEKFITVFEEYDMINLKFENLINPCFIHIEEDTVMNDDIEDLTDLF
jgi:hypothetical protein